MLSVRGWAEARWLRRLTLVPILLALALVLLVGGIILYVIVMDG